MNGVQSSLYTVAIALCMFSAGILRGEKARTGRMFDWFTTFLIIEGVGFIFELLMVHPAVPLKSLWLALRMATSLLIAPCVWLTVRESIEDVRPRLSALGGGHGAAIVAGFVMLLPLIGAAHLGLDYPNRLHPLSALHSRVIHGTMLLCIAIFAVQVPYYLWRCRRLVLESSRSLAWLQLPLIAVLTTWVLGLLRTLQCATHAPKELSLFFALADVGATVGAIYLIVRRVSLAETHPAVVGKNLLLSPTPPVAKYVKSRLDAPLRERIKRKLETALATEELYRDSLLNLRSLSRGINEKAHYVSQVINEDLRASFYELVNRHRVERAKNLLLEAPDQTVLEIALAVGFNSKSTFNTAFRRNVGMTPTEFRAAKPKLTES